MHEEPLHLIPDALRARHREGVRHLHRGRPLPALPLDPASTCTTAGRGRARSQRIVFSEKNRVGIGTFSPSRPEVAGHLRADRLHRPLDHRRVRRRVRPAGLPLRRRAEHRQPRHDGVHRDAEVRREVPLRPADALAGAEHQDRPLLDDLRRRGASSRTPTRTSTTPSSPTRRARRCRTASSSSRCPTTCGSRTKSEIYEKLLAAERAARRAHRAAHAEGRQHSSPFSPASSRRRRRA